MTKAAVLEQATPEQEIVTLSTGIRAKIVPVGASLIDDVVARIEDPAVPTFMNEEKGREEENPNDPHYLIALQVAARQRANAAMETMLLFGLELVDGLPEDDSWLKRLKFLEQRGILDLSPYPEDDSLAMELMYKKYIATGTSDLVAIGRKAGLNSRDVEEAAQSFKSQSLWFSN